MKKSIRMKPGAPPDSELKIRLSYSRTYEPDPKSYQGENPPDGTMLGYLLYDRECVEEGYYALDEAIDLGNEGIEITFELVDADGTVWSEYYNPELQDE